VSALLFDRIGFLCGVRIFANATTTPQRAALALGIDPNLKPLDALKAWMEKRPTLKIQKPVVVKDTPSLENFYARKKVNLAKLPAPYWHRQQGISGHTSGIFGCRMARNRNFPLRRKHLLCPP
jgi:4-hydroxy-3-polyprenylbenzoate decarboxylase